MADNSKPLYCHWDSHLEDVPFMSEGELDMHIKAHFALHDEDTVACHWDACHELIEIDKIMDHFKETHQNNAGHPHYGDDPCSHDSHHIPSPPDFVGMNQHTPQFSTESTKQLVTDSQLATSQGMGSSLQSPPQCPDHLVNPCIPYGIPQTGDVTIHRLPIGSIPGKIDLTEPYGFVRIHGSPAQPPPVCSSDTPALASIHSHDCHGNCGQTSFTCEWLLSSNGSDGSSDHVCGLEFSSSSDLFQHVLEDHVGHGKKLYTCKWKGCDRCDRPFPQRQKIMRHMQLHAPSRTLKCHVCGARFAEDSLLKAHMRSHTTTRPYTCPYCDRSFKSNRARTIHVRTHTGDKPLVCKFPGCGKRFADTSNLTKHMQTHGEKRFECDSCHRKFARKDHLIRHMRTHAPVSPVESVSSMSGEMENPAFTAQLERTAVNIPGAIAN